MGYAEPPRQQKPPLQDKVREAAQRRLHKQAGEKSPSSNLCDCVPDTTQIEKPSK